MRKKTNQELPRKTIADFKESEKTPLILVLDNVRSLHNIGAMFRTADAFLIEKIVLCGITARPPHRDIHKTALGATESVNWVYEKETLNVIQQLQKEGVIVWAVEQADGATMLDQVMIEPNKKHALVFGNEVTGVQQAVVSACQKVVEIPQWGTKHSLNISVSAGIVIWDFFKALRNP